MFRRFMNLLELYSNVHADIVLSGFDIVDRDGQTAGIVDSVTFRDGRVQVTGWSTAAELTLTIAGAETTTIPNFHRDDVTSKGAPNTLGFKLSLPMSLDLLTQCKNAELKLETTPHSTPIAPIKLPKFSSWKHKVKNSLRFSQVLICSTPDLLAWVVTKQIMYRTSIKERLGLKLNRASCKLEPRFLPSDSSQDIPSERLAKIDIILPVYNAFDVLRECLDRVAQHTDVPWRLIVVEDCSPDQRVRPYLQDWVARHPQAELLENDKNIGFIGSVNRGISHILKNESDASIVLLNSDALVPKNWASRLTTPLTDPSVASVTPMSNDAEIFSIPNICVRTVLHEGQVDTIDAVANRISADAPIVETPTGVGFCMAMGRGWVEKLPCLDTVFGRGYGEEVDWCQKAASLGGRHIALPSLFVEHRGGESFGSAQKMALVLKNNAIVSKRYPNYDRSVQEFIGTDPLASVRMVLALAWAGGLLKSDEEIPVYLAHDMGGGAEHWLEHQISADLERDLPSVILRVGSVSYRWNIELVTQAGKITCYSDSEEDLTQLLNLLPRRKVIYSCTVGDPDPIETPNFLSKLVRPQDSAELLFHDYYPISPSYTLLDSDGIYRGPVVPPKSDPAHTTRRRNGATISLEEWQDAWLSFAKLATLVVFSADSAERVAAVWPALKEQISIRPHSLRFKMAAPAILDSDATPVLATLGDIAFQKGAKIVQDLATKSQKGDLGFRLVVIGRIDPAYSLPKTTKVHGRYRVEDIPHLIQAYGITHWLIPSIWPETFCYTVHEALTTGLPVLSFDIGAQGDAVKHAENGILLPLDDPHNLPTAVIQAMANNINKP